MRTSHARKQTELPPFHTLVAERVIDHATPRSLAESLWEDHGIDLFRCLPREWVVSVLTELVRRTVARRRSDAVHVEYEGTSDVTGLPVGACRMVVKGDYWAQRWLVNGQWRQTRELTTDDLSWLIDSYRKVESEAQMHITFFRHCMSLAAEYRVERLGDLEKRGISLEQDGE